ncbi:hypothetical protein [Pleionea sp. CnH1-48]|uniref:hypothetical protein n=1 Tax=Pleionea sp. CnH1-48 TaxID=2954494 RepID=UPI002096C926|nr:hypothetical protein [Pleionea sp. CnH1-48]MCO7222721.1 hypothetical protein [Pleionea sp. CnH1-48]
MSPIEEIKSKLKKYPNVKFEEKENYICVIPDSENGFDVWFREDEREYTIGFSSWHEHFDKNELKDALNCFVWGLSDACRLKVYLRRGKEYKWQVQSLEDGVWVTFSTTSLFNFSFWRRKTVKYKTNALIEA